MQNQQVGGFKGDSKLLESSGIFGRRGGKGMLPKNPVNVWNDTDGW